MSLRRLAVNPISSNRLTAARIINRLLSLQRLTVPVPSSVSALLEVIQVFSGTTTWTVPSRTTSIDYLVVAGGGGSIFQFGGVGGAGGAGGLRTGTQSTIQGARLIVTVGGGGTGVANGSNSSVISI